MDNKIGLGILITFIAIITGLVIFPNIAQTVGGTRASTSLVNKTYIAPTKTVDNYTDLQGYQEVIGDYYIYNTSGTEAIPSTNISLIERVGTDGQKTVTMYLIDPKWSAKNVSVVATLGQDGYVEDSGAYAVIGLIIIFAALAIAIVALTPVLRNGFMDLIGR